MDNAQSRHKDPYMVLLDVPLFMIVSGVGSRMICSMAGDFIESSLGIRVQISLGF